MDYAKNRQDQIVLAKSATRGLRYYCPVCGAPVSVKRGFLYKAHFAHAKGSGSADCDLYHPGLAIQTRRATGHTGTGSFEKRADEYRAPILCIVVSGESIENFFWSLRVWLPRSRTKKGRFKFEREPGRLKEVALAQLILEDVLVGVKPGIPKYRATFFSGDVDPEYKAAAEKTIDGLAEDKITVFSTAGHPAKLMADSLVWGGTSLFVWDSSLNLDWPNDLSVGVISENQKWLCTAVTLPSIACAELEDWIFNHTGLRSI